MDTTPNERADAVARLLDSYTAPIRVPGDPDHRRDPEYAAELVGQLLGDLMHYCDGYGVTINNALAEARRFHADETGKDILHPGTTVSVGPRRGVVTTAVFEPDGHTYDVWVIGEREPRNVPSARVEAVKFPPVAAGEGDPLTRLPDAVTRLVDLEARRHLAAGRPASLPDERARRQLIAHLTRWGGTTDTALLDGLAPRIRERAFLITARPPTPLAAEDFADPAPPLDTAPVVVPPRKPDPPSRQPTPQP